MILTLRTLSESFEYLRKLRPFSVWDIPPAEEVEFKLGRSKKYEGYYLRWNTDEHLIYVSNHYVKTPEKLDMVMAHEMVHLVQKNPKHNAEFDLKAIWVCNELGYDVRKF